jgi:phospho-acceptor domain-containing protein
VLDLRAQRGPAAERTICEFLNLDHTVLYPTGWAAGYGVFNGWYGPTTRWCSMRWDKHLVTAARLRQAKHDAERANEAKAVFLAKMNHQLRTPLNAIIGYSEILLDDIEPGVNSGDEEDLKTINKAGRHLLALVSDVLYMPKIESDNIEIAVRSVDLDEFLDDVTATCRNLVSHNGNEFIGEKSPGLGTIETDETRLRQILINLLGNAGKFTKNGKVTLRASRQTVGPLQQIVIAVEDTATCSTDWRRSGVPRSSPTPMNSAWSRPRSGKLSAMHARCAASSRTC